MPKLSIMVPTYNRAGLLVECLESLRTTRTDCEILVSDNASADDTEARVAALGDRRVKYHRHPENVGVVKNHNALWERAQGEYMVMFGDDDLALPGWIDRKVALLDARRDLDLVYTDVSLIDPDGRPLVASQIIGRTKMSYLGGRDDFPSLLVACYVSWQSLVYRRTVYEAVGGMNETLGLEASNDFFWLQNAFRRRQAAYLAAPSVAIRMSPTTLSSGVGHEGAFARDRLRILRYWMLEAPDPPVVTEQMWDTLFAIVSSEAPKVHPTAPDPLRAAVEGFHALRVAYHNRMEGLAGEALAALKLPAPPYALDGRRARAFLLAPDWAGGRWQEALAAYATAFGPDADVTLVVWLDPAQGVAAEQVVADVQAVLRGAGVDPDRAPDLLLIPEALDEAGLAGLYAAVDAVVLAGRAEVARRASQAGKPVINPATPEAFRAAAQA